MPYAARLRACAALPSVPSGRVNLPPSALEALARDTSASFPYTFELRGGRGVTFAGVAQFTAPEGAVELPAAVAEALGGLPEAVTVTQTPLPLATSVTLSSLQHGFHAAAADPRAVLEAALREGGYVALHAGLLLTAIVDGQAFPLAVTATSPPAPAVVVIDCDCDVVLEGAAEADSEAGGAAAGAAGAARVTPLQPGGPSVAGSVALGDYAFFSVRLPAGDDASGDGCWALRVSVVPSAAACGRELDVYAAFPPVSQPTLALHDGAADAQLASPADTRTLELPLPRGSPGVVNVGVTTAPSGSHGPPAHTGSGGGGGAAMQVDDSGAATFSITASVVPTGSSSAAVPPAAIEGAESPPGSVRCPNCRACVPEGTLPLHTAACLRNNVRCPHPDCGALLRRGAAAAAEHAHCADCGALMPARALGKHAALYHTPQPCPAACGVAPLKQAALDAHLRAQCPHRLALCRFCGVRARAGRELPADYNDRLRGHTAHESVCGARTAPCGGCRKPVQLKHHAAHWAAVHPAQAPLAPALDLPSASGPGATPLAGPSALSSGGQSTGGDPTWACAACSFLNGGEAGRGAGGSACAMCGGAGSGPRAAVESASSSVGRAPTPPVASGGGGGLPAPCRNQTCAGAASRSGDAARLRLCSRCYALFGGELPHPEDEGEGEEEMGGLAPAPSHALRAAPAGEASLRYEAQRHSAAAAEAQFEALRARYSRQLSSGCSLAGCSNAHCVHTAAAASAAPASSSSSLLRSAAGVAATRPAFESVPAHVAWLLEQARAASPAYYVCLPDLSAKAAGGVAAGWRLAGGAPGQPALSGGGGSAGTSRATTPSGSPALQGGVAPAAATAFSGGFSLSAPAPGLPRAPVPPAAAAGAGGRKKAATPGSRVAGAFF